MTVGERIRQIRCARGMTQAYLAEQVHISRGYQCRIEKGSSPAPLDYICDAAKVLQVSTQTLLADYLTTPESDSPAEQAKLLIEKLLPSDQELTLQIVETFVLRLSSDYH